MDPLQQAVLDLVNWSNGVHPTLFRTLKAIYARYYPVSSGMGDTAITSAAPFNAPAMLKTLDNVVIAAGKYMPGTQGLEDLKTKVAAIKALAFGGPATGSVSATAGGISSIPSWVWLAGGAAVLWWLANKKM